MKKLLFIFYLLFTFYYSKAQRGGESKLPLSGNYELSNYVRLHTDPIEKQTHQLAYNKTGIADSSFPLVDRFTNSGSTILSSNWQDNYVIKVGQSVVFDALRSPGNVYPGNTYGQADQLTTLPMKIPSYNNLYIEFNYSGGSTWNDGDSLELQIQYKSGNWSTFWKTSTFDLNKTILLQINQSTFVTDSLDPSHIVFRFINLTNLYAGNTEDFILNYFIFAQKLSTPLYENMSLFSSDSFPSKIYWNQTKTKIVSGLQYGLTWCNPAVFDAFDENNNVYNGSIGAGFADTLASHYIDLTNFNTSDSVFLRFYYRALPNSKNTDSLILQFRNVSGSWITVKGFGGTPFSSFKSYKQYINLSAFKSSLFQFRLINKCSYISSESFKWIASGFNIGKKLSLPVIEDFSTSIIYPNQSLWKDKLVYINNNFPIAAPSFNVATFDGLDSRGNPYGFGRGYCDSLTSWPINLSGYTAADSIYLSFFIEPMGLGGQPNAGDSFIVEMRNSAYDPSLFTTIWSDVPYQYSDSTFTQIFIKIDSSYLHDDFQFRFKNIGSLTGNLEHWNLDYIRIDRGRNKKDTSYFDYAISNVPFSLLKKYSSLPWAHYILNPSLYNIDTQYFYVKNNSASANNINYSRIISDQQQKGVDTFSNVINLFSAGQFYNAFISKKKPLVAAPTNSDTIYFNCKYAIKEATAVDYIPTNDTFVSQTVFSNYFAYDDGSAEAGYDVANRPGSVALGYTLNKPDTLFGIAVFFNQSKVDVTGRSFNFKVWKDIALPPVQTGETVLTDIIGNPCIYPFPGPVYQNKINGFYYYKFHDPILVDSTFYIGWQQNTTFELNVGLDQNYQINGKFATNPMMYFKTTDVPQWQQTQLTGALMMRPIVGKWLDPPLAVKETPEIKNELSIFPNPANNYINIQSTKNKIISVELYDLTGRLITSERFEDKLILPSLRTGIYLLRVNFEDLQVPAIRKIIIQQ
jgi:hypothetical protein